MQLGVICDAAQVLLAEPQPEAQVRLTLVDVASGVAVRAATGPAHDPAAVAARLAAPDAIVRPPPAGDAAPAPAPAPAPPPAPEEAKGGALLPLVGVGVGALGVAVGGALVAVGALDWIAAQDATNRLVALEDEPAADDHYTDTVRLQRQEYEDKRDRWNGVGQPLVIAGAIGVGVGVAVASGALAWWALE